MKGETQLQRNIIWLRESHGLTRSKMAFALGMSIQLLDYYEGRQLNSPDAKLLKKISTLFKVSIDYLVREDISEISKEKIKNNYMEIQSYLKMK
jgi:transcriptional regulator with XRE-family HTH domain